MNDTTLKFTAPKDYSGPASITFTAADGKGNDKTQIINSAVLTLPITVIGREVPPPTFSSSTIDVVAGEDAKIIDLTALTHSPLAHTKMRSSTHIPAAANRAASPRASAPPAS